MNYNSIIISIYFHCRAFGFPFVIDKVLLIINAMEGSNKGVRFDLPRDKKISLTYISLCGPCDGNKACLGTTEVQLLLKRSSKKEVEVKQRILVKHIKRSVSDGMGQNCPLSSAEASHPSRIKVGELISVQSESPHIKCMRQKGQGLGALPGCREKPQ